MLFYLETVVGIPAMEEWFRVYIQDFTNKTLDSDEFKKHFIDYMTQVSPMDNAFWKRY